VKGEKKGEVIGDGRGKTEPMHPLCLVLTFSVLRPRKRACSFHTWWLLAVSFQIRPFLVGEIF